MSPKIKTGAAGFAAAFGAGSAGPTSLLREQILGLLKHGRRVRPRDIPDHIGKAVKKDIDAAIRELVAAGQAHLVMRLDEETEGREPEHSAWRAFSAGFPAFRFPATALYGTRRDAKIVCAGNRAAMVGTPAHGQPRGPGPSPPAPSFTLSGWVGSRRAKSSAAPTPMQTSQQ